MTAIAYILRCINKDCRTGLGRLTIKEANEVMRFAGTYPTRCIKCHQAGELKVIMGRYSNKRDCDPRCTGAISDKCECPCGGENHGGSFAA